MKLQATTKKPIKTEPDFDGLTIALLEEGQIVEAEKVNDMWFCIGDEKYISKNHTIVIKTPTKTRKDKAE